MEPVLDPVYKILLVPMLCSCKAPTNNSNIDYSNNNSSDPQLKKNNIPTPNTIRPRAVLMKKEQGVRHSVSYYSFGGSIVNGNGLVP